MINKSNRKKEVISKKNKENILNAKDYEESKELLHKSSLKIAWIVATIMSFISILLTIAIIILMPLKERVPMLLGFNNSTGVVNPITSIDRKSLSNLAAKPQLDKYFINNYIQLREGYTYQTIQKTYEETQIFSSDEVSRDFKEIYSKEDSLDKKLKTGTATVKVLSITLEKIGGENLATARIEITERNSKNEIETKNYIVRLTYEYKPQLGLSLSERMENPLGFFITSYQKTQENI